MNTLRRLVSLFAGVLAWGCPALPPVTAAERPAPMTREEELRLAAEICAAAWEESANAGYYARRHLLVPLATADAQLARALADAAPEDQRQTLHGLILKGLGQAGPEQAVADALTREKAEPWFLLDTAQRAVAADKAGATALLDKALGALRGRKVEWVMANGLARAAAIARQLGDPRAPELVAEVERLAPEILRQGTAANQPDNQHDWWGGYRCVAEALAAADPDAGLRLVEQVPDAAHRERILLDVIADGVLQVDRKRALALLDAHPLKPASQINLAFRWSSTGRKVALTLAKEDVAAAEALIRRLPRAADRAESLAMLAMDAPPERAAALRREALEAAGTAEPHEVPRTLLRLAELFPPGPERSRICAQALETRMKAEHLSRSNSPLPQVAFVLAPTDRQGARVLLEDALAGCGEEEGAAHQRKAVAMAFAAIDPARAVEVAKGIPAAEPHARFDALRKIAQYLVATPEVRASIHFDRWAASDTWTPGEETQW